MNILIATDKFKDALPADAVCQALKEGILRSFPSAQIETLPLADGGEGTLEVLHRVLGGTFVQVRVQDPLGRPVEASYLWWPESRSAVIEMARASGLELLAPGERNCLITSSYGTGELIAHALGQGLRHLTLTVGGTATNDGGMGMAAALGYRFLDAAGNELAPIGQNLGLVARIDSSARHPALAGLQAKVATDVSAPFYGPEGAAQVYAPQKGADAAGVALLDAGLEHFADCLHSAFSQQVQQIPGSGAGGGMGGGAVCFLNAGIRSAAGWVLELCAVPEKLAAADLLITGEGKSDAQSTQGKLISHLLTLAGDVGKPAILVCGTLSDTDALLQYPALRYAVSILDRPLSLTEAIAETQPLLVQQGRWLGRWLSRN
ncbi:MAG: glycerate kinase [Bacteroidetes bacterium]|nr:MAG: glycerate kinase [Bacteroidota bacterium]